MGFYINPDAETWGTKEDWLTVFGEVVKEPEWPPAPDLVLVCLVDNGPFTAAAICYNEQEFDEFNRDDEPRPRKWYVVPKVDIIQVCPDVAGVLS